MTAGCAAGGKRRTGRLGGPNMVPAPRLGHRRMRYPGGDLFDHLEQLPQESGPPAEPTEFARSAPYRIGPFPGPGSGLLTFQHVCRERS